MQNVQHHSDRRQPLDAVRSELNFWIRIADSRRLIPTEKAEMRRVLERFAACRKATDA